MENYQLAKDVAMLLQRVDTLEKRLQDVEDFGLQKFFIHDESLSFVNLGTEVGNGITVEKLEYYKGNNWWIDGMEHVSSNIKLYSNGSYDTVTVLKDHSEHRKYGNAITFALKFKDTGNILGNISNFQGNFSPGEQKPYSTSGHSD